LVVAHLVRDGGLLAAFDVAGPGRGQVQGTVVTCVPMPEGVGEVDGDLGVLAPAGGAGVLALDANRVRALLQLSGLVHHEHGLLVRQMLQHVAAQVVAEQVGVPLCPPEQVLQPPVRGGVPDVLDYGPAVLARQVREQSKDQVLYLTPGFNPREAARDPLHQALERLLPPGTVYAVTCGHCTIFSLPTPMINGGRTRFHSALTADRARRTYATRRSLVGRVR
jgi:hypothetical protein